MPYMHPPNNFLKCHAYLMVYWELHKRRKKTHTQFAQIHERARNESFSMETYKMARTKVSRLLLKPSECSRRFNVFACQRVRQKKKPYLCNVLSAFCWSFSFFFFFSFFIRNLFHLIFWRNGIQHTRHASASVYFFDDAIKSCKKLSIERHNSLATFPCHRPSCS